MISKKRTIRFVTFFSILLFLLMPLLSSPVAAGFTLESECSSENLEDGPVVEANLPSGGPFPKVYPDVAPRTAIFELTYVFVDSTTEGEGSEHYAILYVQRLLPTGEPFVKNTGHVPQLPGTSSSPPKTLQIKDDWIEDEDYYWHVYVTMGCRQLPDGEWVEDSVDYVVEVF